MVGNTLNFVYAISFTVSLYYTLTPSKTNEASNCLITPIVKNLYSWLTMLRLIIINSTFSQPGNLNSVIITFQVQWQ